jgi:ABC-2 type transport system permease protein
MMRGIAIVAKREFAGYFATPLAVVFLVIFLGVSAALPFFIGGFFDHNDASLQSFFSFHPWIYLVLVPAIGMRLWAEERKSGTVELLMTLPLTMGDLVIGKFLAGWAFITLALALTFPMWITINYLGSPDNGVVLAGYIASWFLAGSMLAVTSCFSACTRNQVIAFILSVIALFILLMSGLEIVLAFFRIWAPHAMLQMVSGLSLLTHYASMTKGVIDLAGAIFFVSLMALGLFATAIVLEGKKAR